MQLLWDNRLNMLEAFGRTLEMMLLGGLIALVVGFFLAGLRVSPINVARFVGAAYVNVVRNTPLLVIMFIFAFGLPELDIRPELNLNRVFGTDFDLLNFNTFFIFATSALGLYTAAFICEAVRSGINSVAVGQAEAARSIGMTFGQTLFQVVFPQAFRAVVPPLVSVLIAMTKNTTVALGVGVTEATFLMSKLANDHTSQIWWLFGGFAVGYMILVFSLAGIGNAIERRVRVS